MSDSQTPRTSSPTETNEKSRLPWVSPRIAELPRLTELTLQTGIPGECGTGGSTCF